MSEIYLFAQENSVLLNQLLRSIVCGDLSQLRKIEVMMKLSSVDPELLSLALVRLQAGWYTLIGRALNELCSDWLMLLCQLSSPIRVAFIHAKVLLGVA